METARKFRIGIDVGGTFTDVVAIDATTSEIAGYAKAPTTHTADEGVASGILQALREIIEQLKINPTEIVFLAHSTTQATNALLEGDVSRIGIIATGSGLIGWQTKFSAAVGDLVLAEGRLLRSIPVFINSSSTSFDKEVANAVQQFSSQKVGAVVAAEAFSVDTPARESKIADAARAAGLPATATHEVSSLYGLRLRVRTAALNAAILPRMMETSERTAAGVSRSGIDAPLMIMRSDGGVMSLEEMRRRPILSFLSGPAAGIAGALMYEKVSDGIFLEVGGTSTDISVIRDGLPQTRSASVGGQRIFLNTLDVRTIGLAGGSMLRVTDGRLAGVGSRSAHIAGCRYLTFSTAEDLEGAVVKEVTTAGDETNRYLILESRQGVRIAPTLTCAANFLGYVEEEHYARGNRSVAEKGFALIAEHLQTTPEKLVNEIFDLALAKVEEPLQKLILEYRLDAGLVELVGGGGGAAAILPALQKRRGWTCRISRNAPIISAIGVALAMVKEVVERTVVNPTDEDVLRVRHEAKSAAIRAGAIPETVEVRVEADRQKSILRATATGAAEIREADEQKEPLPEAQLLEIAARSLAIPPEDASLVARAEGFAVFRGKRPVRRLWGLWKSSHEGIRVLDRDGVVRLRRSQGKVVQTTTAALGGELSRAITDQSSFGDAGQILPDVFLLHSGRIANFTGIAQVDHVSKLAMDELQGVRESEPVVLLVCQRDAGG